MPITPENRARYPADWPSISREVRDRSGGRCECEGECGLHVGRRCTERNGRDARFARGKVILTVAHLDHTPENVERSNLRAMCQRCHLRYDRDHHSKSARERRHRQRAVRELW